VGVVLGNGCGGGAAEPDVTGIEAESDERRVEALGDESDLSLGLDVGAGVGMDHGVEAHPLRQLAGTVQVGHQRLAPIRGQPGLRVLIDRARQLEPVRFAEQVGQNRLGRAPVRRALAQVVQGDLQPGEVVVDVLRTREAQREVGREQLQTVVLEDRAALGWFAEEALGPELVPSRPSPAMASMIDSGVGRQPSVWISSTPNETGADPILMSTTTQPPFVVQNIASGLTAEPVPPGIANGAIISRNALRRKARQASRSASMSTLSRMARPIALSARAWKGSARFG
jgi:hypothetical protein